MFSSDTTTSIIVLIIYLAVLLTVGFIAGRKVKSGADYAIGGRNVPGWVAALSERATDMSAFLALGTPGTAYLAGMSSIWAAIGGIVGAGGAWWIISNQMRKEAEKYGALTYIDWVAKRHGEKAKSISIVGGAIIAFFFIIYVAAQLLGGGSTLNTLLGLNPVHGILLTAAIVIPYTLYGGFGSVVYTDCLQAIILLGLLVVVPVTGLFYMRNNPDIVYAASFHELFALAGPKYSSIWGGAKGLAAGAIFGNGMAWTIAYLGGLPQLNIRFMSIKDEKNFKLGRKVSVAYMCAAYAGAILIGLIGHCILGPGLANHEQVTPTLTLYLLPTALATLFITGIIAAMLSTADSLLVLASSEVSENIIKPHLKIKNMSEQKNLRLSRLITLIIILVALAMAFVLSGDFIYNIVSWVWAGLGSPFAVCTLLTLYWKKYTGTAALWTMVGGMLFTIVWIVTGLDSTITAMFTGAVAALVIGIAVSFMTQPKQGNSTQNIEK